MRFMPHLLMLKRTSINLFVILLGVFFILGSAGTPEITILGDNPVTIQQGSVYVDAGATAKDDDGPRQISTIGLPIDTSILGTHKVTYSVKGSDGQLIIAERIVKVIEVVVNDNTPPVITILGNNPVTVQQGDTYTDAGATAVDDIDGSVTVKTSGSVDTSKVGTYTITYTAIDKAANKAIKTREVKVVQSKPIAKITLKKNIEVIKDQFTIKRIERKYSKNYLIVDGEVKEPAKVLNKIIFIPSTKINPDALFLKVSEITKQVDLNTGKITSKLVYTIPELNEVVGKLKIKEGNLISKQTKVTQFTIPTPTVLLAPKPAGKLLRKSAAKDNNGNNSFETMFGNSKLAIFAGESPSRKNEYFISFKNLKIYEKKSENKIALASVVLDGLYSFQLLDFQIPTNIDNSNYQFKVETQYISKMNANLTIKGGFDFNFTKLLPKDNGIQCGTLKYIKAFGDEKSKKESYGKIEFKGAKWKDNLCLGGFRLAVGTFQVLLGNGNDQSVLSAIPITLDFFLTMNQEFKITLQAKLSLGYHEVSKKGVSIYDGKLTRYDKSYDPDIFGATGEKKAAVLKTSLEGKISGSTKITAGAALGLRFANIYPAVVEGYGGIELSGSLSKTGTLLSDGEVIEVSCSKLKITPIAGIYAAFGASFDGKVVLNDGFLKATYENDFFVGAKYEHVFTIKAFFNKNTCKYKGNGTYDIYQSKTGFIIKNFQLVNKDGYIVKNDSIKNYVFRIYDASANLVKEIVNSDGSVDVPFGKYTVDLFVQLIDGNIYFDSKDIVRIKTPKVISKKSGDGFVELTWNKIEGAISYEICYAREEIKQFENCYEYTDGNIIRVKSDNKDDLPPTKVRITKLINAKNYYFRILAVSDINSYPSASVMLKPMHEGDDIVGDVYDIWTEIDTQYQWLERIMFNDNGLKALQSVYNFPSLNYKDISVLEKISGFPLDLSSSIDIECKSNGSSCYNTFKSKDFIHVNPKVVSWMLDTFLVENMGDNLLFGKVQTYYDAKGKYFWWSFALAYKYLNENHDFEQEVNAYKTAVENDKEMLTYLDSKYKDKIGAFYSGALKNKIPDDLSMDYVVLATGFWLRRGIDGSDQVILDALKKVLESYDSELLELLNTKESSSSVVKLNDTGITRCADVTSNDLDCPVAGFPNQDAQSGRDVTHNDDSDGHAGFSFTKISSTGAELPASATEWSCVKDNVTGLIWEVKTDDGGLHDKDNTYTWYNPDNTTNGGNAGTENGDNDTDSFVNNTNNAGWCGYNDWRMPNREELKSLVDYSIPHYPRATIDSAYFPNVPYSNVIVPSMSFWTSSPTAYNSSNAWVISFYEGSGSEYYKGYYQPVRLVRSGQTAERTITSDDFSSSTINKNNWLVVRHNRVYRDMPTDYSSVSVDNGNLYLLQDRIDDGPQVHSKTIPVQTEGLLVITRRLRLSYANSNYRGRLDLLNSPSQVLNGLWFKEGAERFCGIAYDHDNYRAPDNNFVLGDQLFSPIWNTYFEEGFTYDFKQSLLSIL